MNNKENISVLTKEKCCGCHSCYNICPKKAISTTFSKSQKPQRFRRIFIS